MRTHRYYYRVRSSALYQAPRGDAAGRGRRWRAGRRGSASTSSGWGTCSATRTGAPRCGPTRRVSSCPGSARASSRWPPASTRPAWARRTSRCTTSSPRPPGTTPPCWRRCGPTRSPRCWSGGRVRAWLVDDTGLPKKGRLSAGVARQYCGQLGKRDNCQVAVTLSVATEAASLPVAYRLYLPEAWAGDPARRAMAGVPDEVGFATEPAIALDQIRQALADGVPPGVVVTDAGYGSDTDSRDGSTAQALPYMAGVLATTGVWPPCGGPLPAAPR